MRKLLLVIAAIAAIVLVLGAFHGNRKAIAQARAAALRLASQRDSLVSQIEDRERQQTALERERVIQQAEANRLRDSVAALERRRAEQQLTVRTIRTVGRLQERLRTAFPELGELGWGLTTVPLEHGDTLGLEYLMVPAWFAETFIIDHANAASWREQKDKLLAVDSLQLTVTALQDSITRLVAANADAYEAGYQAAYAGYQDLTQRYVAELKKPRIRVPSAIALLGAAGVGLVIGRAFDD